MAHSPEELIARWRARRDAANTLAVADSLRRGRDPGAAAEVAAHVERHLTSDVGVLMATARMCLANGLLPEAQQLLGLGTKLAPRSGILLRLLGEVQLRRGDAERAEKTLERAARVDADQEIRVWLDRARLCLPLQVREGARAVADHVSTAHPLAQASLTPRALDDDDDLDTNVRSVRDEGRRARPRDDDDLDTQVRSARDAIRPALEALHARRAESAAPARSAPPPPARSAPPPPVRSAPPPPARSAPPPPVRSAPPPPARSAPPPPTSASAPPAVPIIESLPAEAPSSTHAAAPPPHARSAPPPPDLGQPAPTTIPPAASVLEELARAGVFEGASDTPVWTRPEASPPQKRRALVVGAVLLLGLAGAAGAFFYDRDRDTKRRAAAEALLASVDADLAARPSAVDEHGALAGAFALDPGSGHAARAWVRARVIAGLTRGSELGGLVEPIAHARRVGVPESELAYALVAQALFDGDLLRGVELLSIWDDRAARESDYQLVAGLTLARAGAPDAARRLVAATRLAPASPVAELALARHVAIAGPPDAAATLTRSYQVAHPDTPEGGALVALAWATGARTGAAPPEVAQVLTGATELPRSLRFIPHALRALEALKRHETAEAARPALDAAVALAEGPDETCWLGELPLDVRVSWSAIFAAGVATRVTAASPAHPRARRLAARAALAGARLAQAEAAVGALEGNDPLAALVAAVSAYERASSADLAKHLDALRPPKPTAAATKGVVSPLLRPAILNARAILLGTTLFKSEELVALASSPDPWARVFALDAALDAGDLLTAAAISPQLQPREQPEHAARAARLARYEGDLVSAANASELALRGDPARTPEAFWRARVERLFVLVARRERARAVDFVGTAGFGEFTPFALAVARSAGPGAGARDLPDPGALGADTPVPLRLLIARAYGAVRDRNVGFKYVQQLAKAGFTNPDVALAAEGVNLPPVTLRSRSERMGR
ncbi:MAG: hypothetical protein IPF92_11460 [Myxococcales bacterium]|nr:hypothetical protein [Myxococcales bacterium]